MENTLVRSAAPLEESDRSTLLDSLRGFALIGVCLANLFTGFSLWGDPEAPSPASLPTAATDPAAAFLIRALVDGKFYSLFSLLFGIGFAVQLHRSQARGDTRLQTYRRRLWVLLGIGVAHLLLIWSGDILAFYALTGLLLVRLRGISDKALLRWAAALLLLPVPLWAIFWLAGGWNAPVPLTIGLPFYAIGQALITPLGIKTFYQGMANSDWGLFLRSLQAGFFFRFGNLLFQWRVCKVLSMFLLGLWIGRHQIFNNLEAHLPLLRRVAIWGLALGLPVNLLNAYLNAGSAYDNGETLGLAHALLYALGVGPLALAYAALFALAWQKRSGRVLRQLAPLGRMALTCYLTQSVIATFLFTGVGLAWLGRVGPTLLWPLGFAIIAGQLLACRWWLRRFQFGPVEWLWRSLTYRQWQPLRRLNPPLTAPALG
ncbi:DUF418 domain-containing protein [Hymenobacter arizonensis]|uniref:DUF418 domain-containing protein n=1 Tax=Hymenobacter arizonensis TaxID=1227077 RepID=A0A1I5V086_HYMAR|nr:DUF418 domain-containing protein [Hymenobacter arizonensis]SFQ00891.1 uncharacterized protein SAMN04515668_1142 [Hymenobacter arizonensis]